MAETTETVTRTVEVPDEIAQPVAVEETIAAVVAEGMQGANEWQRNSYETLAALLIDIREERAETRNLLTELSVRVKDQTEALIQTRVLLDQQSQLPLPTSAEEPVIIQTTDQIPETIVLEPETRVTEENAVVENPVAKTAKRTRRLI